MARHNNHSHRNGSKRGERVSTQDYRALAEFRYYVRRFWRLTEGNARRAGVHPQQHRLLLAIKAMSPDGTPSVGRLAEKLQVQHHSAVELIDRTVTAGLVIRRRGAKDGRVVTVHVTPRGERLLERLSRENRSELRSAAPALVKALRALTRRTKL
ncbi:MAG TPA: MarR family transcriptional regulator [Terriglobales bacterium]|nr:MarR family transcriptional regulator [Terriglobales bacterium]